MGIISRYNYLNELTVGGEKIDDDDPGIDMGNDDTETTADAEPAENEDDYSLPDDDADAPEDETPNEEEGTDDEYGTDDEIDMGEDEGAESTEETDDAGGEATGEETDDTALAGDEGNAEDDELKQIEDSLYDSLSEDQKKIRVAQLKKNFKDIYDEFEAVLNAINSIPKTDTNTEVVRKLVETVLNCQEYVLDYIKINFDKTSYLDNNQVYIKYINIFRTIKKILDEISMDQKA